MQDVSSEAMICALAVMLFLLPSAGARSTPIRRLSCALFGAVVAALGLSSIFFHSSILMPITNGQRTIFEFAASVLLLAAIIIYFMRGWLAKTRRAAKTAKDC